MGIVMVDTTVGTASIEMAISTAPAGSAALGGTVTGKRQ